eukprot:7025319-Heterocapsa_arctica.AAC.1
MARCSFGGLEPNFHIRSELHDNERCNCECGRNVNVSGIDDYDNSDECAGYKGVYKRDEMFGHCYK